MIDKTELARVIEGELEGTDLFLVSVEVTPDNAVTVEIDSDSRVDIEKCVELTRAVEAAFDREAEDYELEIGSSGLTSPLRLPRQYAKYVGQEVETVGPGGKKLKGVLVSAGPETFTLRTVRKVRPEGAKRPVEETCDLELGYGDVRDTRYLLKF